MISNRIGLFGQLYSRLGVPSHTRELFRAISKERDCDIWTLYPQAFDPYDIGDLKSRINEYRGSHERYENALCFWPWHDNKDLDYMIHMTVFEGTKPKVKNFDNVRKLCTASIWGTNILRSMNLNCQIGNPIYAGVDSNYFNKNNHITNTDKPYKFLMVAKPEVRKGLDIGIKAFSDVVTDPDQGTLTLLIHDPFNVHFSIMDFLKELDIPNNGVIEVLTSPLETKIDMAKLYRDHDYLIYPTRAEAIGLPILEAMACGCEPIVTDYGPIREYVGDAGIYIRNKGMIPIYDPVWFKNPGEYGEWADPDIDHLKDIIGNLILNNGHAERSKLCAERMKQFSWARSAKEVLKEI